MIKEYKYPIICFIGIALLHLSALSGGIGYVILALVLVLSSINTLAFIVTGVGAQLLTYPLGLPIQFAQLQVFAFMFFMLFNWEKYAFNTKVFSLKLLFFSLFGFIITIFNNTVDLYMPILTGLLYFVVMSVQLQKTTYATTTILTTFVVSTFLAGIGFWSSVLGINTVSEFYEANELRDIIRMGSGNVDANSVGITIPIGILGLNALLITHQNFLKNKKKLFLIVLSIFLFGIPVVLSTGSRTSLIVLVLGFLILLFGAFVINKQTRMDKTKKSISWKMYLFMGILGVVAILTTPAAQKILNALQNVNSFEQEQYSSGVASGRSNLWIDFGKIVLEHPLFGCPSNLRFTTAEVGTIYYGDFQAHNTYIEVATLLGIPLTLVFFSFFFSPLLQVRKKYTLSESFPIYAISFAFFMSFLAISAHSWKTFYIFLSILAMIEKRSKIIKSE